MAIHSQMKIHAIALGLTLAALTACHSKSDTLSWNGLGNADIHDVESGEIQNVANAEIFDGSAKDLRFKVIRRITTPDEAHRQWSGIDSTVRSFYANLPTPYPGMVTNKTACPDEYLPKPAPEQSDAEVWKRGIQVFSNDRFTFGICIPEEKAYRALVMLLECVKKNLSFEIKVFESTRGNPPSRLDEIYRAFRCI